MTKASSLQRHFEKIPCILNLPTRPKTNPESTSSRLIHFSSSFRHRLICQFFALGNSSFISASSVASALAGSSASSLASALAG